MQRTCAVTWDDNGDLCENCDTWYHTACHINDSMYERLNSDVSWTFRVCDEPN